MKFNSVWQELKYVELIEVDKVEANCVGLSSGCIIKKVNIDYQHLCKVIGDL